MKKTLWSTLLALAAVISVIVCMGGITVLADDNDNNDSSDPEDVVVNTIDSVSADNESVDNKAGDHITWHIDDETLILTGYGRMYSYDNDYHISPWRRFSDRIYKIVLDDQITYIGDYAFSFLPYVSSVEMPQNLEWISYAAFANCPNLSSVLIPSQVKIIEPEAFSNCNNLREISIPRELENLYLDVFSNDPSLTDIYLDVNNPANFDWRRLSYALGDVELKIHVRSEYQSACESYCNSLNLANIEFVGDLCGEMVLWNFSSNTLTISGTGDMFDYSDGSAPWYINRSRINYVVIQDGVTSIGNNAFYNFSNLRNVTIPDGIKGIGFQSFKNCPSLTSVSIPDSVTYIGGNAFYQSALNSLSISGDCGVIESSAFACCEYLETVMIDSTLSEIGDSAFYSCIALKSVTLPDSITDIGKYAFSCCAMLDTINLPEGLSEICEETFSYCNNLTSIEIPDSVNSIGYNAFKSSGLTSVDIPCNVLYIETGAFRDCKLTSVVIPGNVQEIGLGSFAYNSLTTIELCDGIKYVKELAFAGNHGLSSITFPGSVEYIEDNVVSDCSITSIVLLDGVEKIGDYAFCGLDTLTTVDIPGSVTVIDQYAFSECPLLNTVNMSNGIGVIETKAFINCTSLKSIVIPDSVTYIGSDAFSGCSSLKTAKLSKNLSAISNNLFYDCSKLETVIISNGIKHIGSYAFCDCNKLQNVYIPNGVESIGKFAFYCCEELTTVTIPESVTEIGLNAFAGCLSVTDVYCFAIPDKLTWYEDERDFGVDWNNYDVKITVCHVNTDYVDAFNSKFSDVNVIFTGGVENISLGENASHLYGYTLSLDGNIGVNFHMTLDNSIVGPVSTAYMLFTVNGRTSKIMVKDLTPNPQGYYVFRCDVAAKEMTDDIIAQLYVSDGIASGSPYTYCVRDYASYILNHVADYDSKTIDLVKAMLNYGAYSQKYFKHNTGNLANSILSTYDGYVAVLDTAYISNYAFSGTKQISAANRYITFVSANIELESEIVLNFYIKGMPDGVAFTCNGQTLKSSLTSDGSYTVVSITGIAAKDIDSDFTIWFTIEGNEYSFTYSPMNYCYNVISRPETETRTRELKEAISAMYWYNQAANAYVG